MLAFAANAEGPAPVEVMIGIDCDGDFPYDAVQTWAKTHGRAQDLEAMGAAVEKRMQEESKLLSEHGVAGELRFLNDPATIAAGQSL